MLVSPPPDQKYLRVTSLKKDGHVNFYHDVSAGYLCDLQACFQKSKTFAD